MVKTCSYCAQHKTISGADHLVPIESTRCFERLVTDLKDFNCITTDGNPRYLLSFVDHYSSFVFAYPIFTKEKNEVWQCFLDLTYRFRMPEMVHSDNGGEFQWLVPLYFYPKMSSFEDFKNRYNFKTAHSIARNPRVQGKVERWNETVSSWIGTLSMTSEKFNCISVVF